jgi:hypothetical protein
MDTLLYRGLNRARLDRHENLVRVGELTGQESIEGIVELNVQGAATRWPLSHVVGVGRRETSPAPV